MITLSFVSKLKDTDTLYIYIYMILNERHWREEMKEIDVMTALDL